MRTARKKKEEENGTSSLWQSIINESKESNQTEAVSVERNIVFFGNEKNGKSKLINFLQGDKVSRELEDVKSKETNTFGLNYSYMKHEKDHLNLYEIENWDFLDMLDLILKDMEVIKNTLFVITLDVTKIKTIEDDLSTWLEKITTFMNEKLYKRMNANEVQDWKKENEKKYQNKKKQDGLTKNLGVPLVVAVCKSDSVWKVAEAHHQQKYAFDFMNPGDISHYFLNFLQYRLRRQCVEYGASLVYTSTKSELTNCKLLKDLMMSTFYEKELPYKPERKRMEAIYVPHGYDSHLTIVDELGEDVRHITKKPDQTPFKTVIKSQGKVKVSRKKGNHGKISWQKFLKTQRTMLKFEKTTKGGVGNLGKFGKGVGNIKIPKAKKKLDFKTKKKVTKTPQPSTREKKGSIMDSKFAKGSSNLFGSKKKLDFGKKPSGLDALKKDFGGTKKRGKLKDDFSSFAASLSKKKKRKDLKNFKIPDFKKTNLFGSGAAAKKSGISSFSPKKKKFEAIKKKTGGQKVEREAMEDFFQSMLDKLQQ